MDQGSIRSRIRSAWPWAVLLIFVVPAVWHVVDFPEDPDDEFPSIRRPTFSRLPPPAYRLAEPGDTIDRISIYASAAAVVFSVVGLAGSASSRRPIGPWVSALGLGLAGIWHAATPGPTFDGWHGLGFRAAFDPSAPWPVRLAIGAWSLSLSGMILIPMALAGLGRVGTAHLLLELEDGGPCPPHGEGVRPRGLPAGRRDLLVGAAIFVALRQFEIPGVEPVGYWPRWSLAWGLIAFDLALVLDFPPISRRRSVKIAMIPAVVLGWVVLTIGAIDLSWYHRPLERMRAVEPGKIYISAMPSYRGLKIAQERHHFKTIINLFPEDTAQRSSRWPQELRFVKETGVRYLRSPNGAKESDAFLDQTLALARDPEAWPILVHCHGCMDRSPAWMGIYRFTVQGRPLGEIMTEIERHRGYRPKASVTLLYNRVLAARAPERFANDPTAALLKRCAEGTDDPYYDDVRREILRANATGPGGVRIDPGTTLDTPRRLARVTETKPDRRPVPPKAP